MRYDDWDVILFPKDSQVPIQEFKTACYNVQDAEGRKTPTLTCYISSLPPSTPFRISVHSWAIKARPSAAIESCRKANQKIMYTAQVIVDGERVFRGLFNVGSKWPQEIAHEKQTITFADHPTSQRKLSLRFPHFSQPTLLQPAWKSQELSGRINIVLSEQLICRNDDSLEPDLGMVNDIACFSFQHAPKDILEQAGISWPIRNPLYLSGANSTDYKSPEPTYTSSIFTKTQSNVHSVHMQSPLSHTSTSSILQRPRSHPPPLTHFPKSLNSRGRGRADMWDSSFGSIRDSYNNLGPESWSNQQSTSDSTGDLFMDDCIFASSQSSKPRVPWTKLTSRDQKNAKSRWNDQGSGQDQDRQVIMTLRDDQFGQIMQALSPPKRHQNLPGHTSDSTDACGGLRPVGHSYPPKMGNISLAGRPSAASLTRKTSFPNLGTASRIMQDDATPGEIVDCHKVKIASMYHPSTSSNKENLPPSQSRLSTPFLYANRVPAPNLPASMPPQWDSDVSMRDPSSLFSGYHQFNADRPPVPSEMPNKHSGVHAPSTMGSIKSRKEGLALYNLPRVIDSGIRHDQSLLPLTSNKHNIAQKPKTRDPFTFLHNTPTMHSKPTPTPIEIIDVDAIDPNLDADEPTLAPTTKLSSMQSSHKSGMSSVDSTVRIEQTLFSALRPEYSTFEPRVEVADMGDQLEQAMHHSSPVGTPLNPNASTFEPAGKRKRRGTMGLGSPVSKREKGGDGDIEKVDEDGEIEKVDDDDEEEEEDML